MPCGQIGLGHQTLLSALVLLCPLNCIPTRRYFSAGRATAIRKIIVVIRRCDANVADSEKATIGIGWNRPLDLSEMPQRSQCVASQYRHDSTGKERIGNYCRIASSASVGKSAVCKL